jgi:integrase
MNEKGVPGNGHDALLEELEGIRDVYRGDVKQFVAFVREKKLLIVEGFRQYARWLDQEHEGKSYSPATINRKLSAARSRVRYAFKHSAFAASLKRKYHLEDILKSAKLKKLDAIVVSPSTVLDIREARRLVLNTRNKAIRMMITFLLRTGVRVSEMLHVRVDDVTSGPGPLARVRVRGKAGKIRTINVRRDFLEQVQEHFHGRTLLFEHDGRGFNRVSVTNRIKLESLRILGREVSPLQLRHTWAAIQIKRGRGVNAVAALMGHADPGLTARMYPDGALKPEEAYLDLDESPRTEQSETDDDGGKTGN